MLGLYQLLCTSVAAHAAISETVEAAKQLGMEELKWCGEVLLCAVQHVKRNSSTMFSNKPQNLPSWLAKAFEKKTGASNWLKSAMS